MDGCGWLWMVVDGCGRSAKRLLEVARLRADRPHPKNTPSWSRWGRYVSFSSVDGCGRSANRLLQDARLFSVGHRL